jgi:hypothetical protein
VDESIIVPIHGKDDKFDCNNYRGILCPFIDEIIGDHLNIRTPPYTKNVSACFIVHSLHYMFRP